jgi:hypothetical protein
MSTERTTELSTGRSTGTTTATLPEERSDWGRLRERARRHVEWVRRDGLARLIEEDGLDPRERIGSLVRARRWRRDHAVEPGTARAAFVVGVQRSGTNMVVRGIEHDPAVEVHNENDRHAFTRFQLRGDDVTRELVTGSRHELVLFKPLCDSHRIGDLLDELAAGGTDARAVWVYRGVDGRARSAVQKFGDVNRRVLADIADGRAGDRWQAQRLSEASLDLIRSVEPERLDPHSAAALFWLVRNRLYFEQGLAERADVHLVGYERVVADPEPEIGALASFLEVSYTPELHAHIDRRAARVAPLDLDPRVRAACAELEAALGEAAERSFRRRSPEEGR